MNIHRILQYYYEHPEKFKIYHNSEDQITNGLFRSKIFNSVSMPIFESWAGGDIGYERVTFMRNGIIREVRLLCGTLIFEYSDTIRDWLRTNIIDIKRYFDFGQCHMMTFIDPITNEKSLIISLPVYAHPVTRFLFIRDIIQRIQALPVEKPEIKFVRPKYVLSNRYQHIIEMVHRFMDVVESRHEAFLKTEYDYRLIRVRNKLIEILSKNKVLDSDYSFLEDLLWKSYNQYSSTEWLTTTKSCMIDLSYNSKDIKYELQRAYFKLHMVLLLRHMSRRNRKFYKIEKYIKETFFNFVIPDKEIFKSESPKPTPQPFLTDDAKCVRSVKYLMLMSSPEYRYEEMLKQYPEKPFRVPKNEIWTLVHYPNGIIINSVYDISHWLKHPLLKEISINYTDRTLLITRDVFGFMCERFTKHGISGPYPISKIKVRHLFELKNIRYIHVTLNENKYVMNT